MTTQKIATKLGAMNVDVQGTGPAIIFWPSLSMDLSLWDAQVAYFRDRYTTIAIDPPGHGESDKLTAEFTLEDSAECLGQILDGLGIGKTHVVGNSWGAMVGAVFAAKNPERVISAVLANGTASATPEWYHEPMEAFCRDILKPEMRQSFRDMYINNFLGETTEKERPDLVNFVINKAESVDPKSASITCGSVALKRKDNHALFGTIKCPCVVVAGDEDRSFPVSDLEKKAAAIPGSELIVLEKVGHLAAIEAPEKFNQIIEDFIKKSC